MAGALARTLTQHIVTVSRKVAKQQSGIFRATVLDRNPDGTLVVDDGQGGCRRVVGAANVRIGDQIIVGTEPTIGTITSLNQQNFNISPSSLPCPDDGNRPLCEEVIGVPCPPPIDTTEFGNGGSFLNAIADNWENRQFDFGAGPTHCYHALDGFYHRTGWTGDGGGAPALGNFLASSRAYSNYMSVFADCHSTNTANKGFDLECGRGYFEFPNPVPPWQIAVGATLEFSIYSNVAHYRSDDDIDVIIVPSHVGFPASGFESSIDFTELGRYRILDTVGHTGASNYGVSIPLDAVALQASGILAFSTIRLAMITEYDFDGARPPMPGLAAFLAAGTPSFDRRNILLCAYPSLVTAPPRLKILTANA
jgi:hypothetical protein